MPALAALNRVGFHLGFELFSFTLYAKLVVACHYKVGCHARAVCFASAEFKKIRRKPTHSLSLSYYTAWLCKSQNKT